ncbi:MAG: TlpA family protein disulfide reductase [Acidimicrobiales bacterium]
MAPDDKPKNRQGFNTDVNRKKATTSPTITANDSSNRGFTIAILALVVIGLGGIAFLAANRDSDISDAPQTAEVTIEGPAVIEFPRDQQVAVTNATTDAAVGQTAPTLVGTNFDGTEVRIEPDGTPKAVYFLAHHCPFCQEEVPVLQGLVDSGQKPDNIEVIAVSTSVVEAPNRNYPPETWLNREGWTSPVIRDDELSRAFNAYGGISFPYGIYLDGDNNIVARSAGQLDETITLTLWQNLATGALIDSVVGDGENQSDADAEPVDTTDGEEEEPSE